jgi:hypothetical protein
MKELINNAYDADATLERVFVRPDADRIIVADDGHGISADEFHERHFHRIAESTKRSDGELTESGRSKIGKIGIALSPQTRSVTRSSSFRRKRGSRDRLRDFDRLCQDAKPSSDRKTPSGDVAKADYEGAVFRDATPDDHYTGTTSDQGSDPRRGRFSSLPGVRAE